MKPKRFRFSLFYILSFLVMAFVPSACVNEPPKQDTAVIVKDADGTETEQNQIGSTAETTENEQSDKDLEAVKEAVNTTIDLGKAFIKNLKVNDSIKMSHREKMFAYQIGLPIRHERDIFEEYKKLYDVESVYILKISRKDHYIIKYEGKTEEDLQNELADFKSQLPAEITGGVKIINLARLCSKRDNLKIGEKITRRKENTELPCLICD